MAVEQLKSTTVVNLYEVNSRRNVLTENEVYDLQSRHENLNENLDVTADQPDDNQIVESEPSGTSYNLDVHTNSEQFLSVHPGPSISDEDGTSLANEAMRDATVSQGRDEEHTSVEQTRGQTEDMASDENANVKVFVLHFTDDDDGISQDAILQLASSLRHFNVNVILDLIEKDTFQGNWNIWHEKELKEASIVPKCSSEKQFCSVLYKLLGRKPRFTEFSLFNGLSGQTSNYQNC